MSKILIQKINKKLRNGLPNPKSPDQAWWNELLVLLKDHEVVQLPDILTWNQMKENLDWCDTFIAVDSYFQHFAWYHGKKGIVVWGTSDPLIFGHDIHINLLKDRKNLRPFPFKWWEEDTLDMSVFVSPQEVASVV